MDRIKLMQVVLSLDVGGLEHLVVNLSEKLPKEKYDISICSLSLRGELNKNLEKRGISIYTLPKKDRLDYTLVLRLVRLFRKQRVQIVHTHNTAPWLYAGIAAKLAGCRLIHTAHSRLLYGSKGLLLIQKGLSFLTESIISDSHYVADHLIKESYISSRKIKIIFNGIEIDRFKGDVNVQRKKKSVGVTSADKLIGVVARLVPVKDHETLLKAFKVLHKKFPSTALLIIGDGPMKENLEQKAQRLGLNKKVKFLGSRNDVPELLQILDIFVLSSKSEGLSLTLLEAMAARKPIVATRVGGNPEVILDGQNGFLVSAENPQEMASALLRILLDPHLGDFLANKGWKVVKEKFSLNTMTDMYQQVYLKSLNKKLLEKYEI